jgi:hypothetical protein
MMMEAARTSETSVDNHFTRQYNPEDSSELLYIYQASFNGSNVNKFSDPYFPLAFVSLSNRVTIGIQQRRSLHV